MSSPVDESEKIIYTGATVDTEFEPSFEVAKKRRSACFETKD
jgi:hypothetical protein